jgi:hypothetical protein
MDLLNASDWPVALDSRAVRDAILGTAHHQRAINTTTET